MRNWKKLVVALAGALALVACGEDEAGSDHNNNESNNTTNSVNSDNDMGGVDMDLGPEMSGAFVDSPVEGLTYVTAGFEGHTGGGGGFSYHEGQNVEFKVGGVSLGYAIGASTLSPMDLFPVHGMRHGEYAVNVAWILQSLDEDGDASNGIKLTESAVSCFEEAVGADERFDVGHTPSVTKALTDMVSTCSANLMAISQEEAAQHLLATLAANGTMNFLNPSQTPTLASAKAKLEILPSYTPGKDADNGMQLGRDVLPLIVVYNDEVAGTGAQDVFAAISLDDGATWQKTNLSQSATKSSFTFTDGTHYPGTTRKTSLKAKGRYMFVTWTSAYCPEEAPGGLSEAADRYGVNGPQGSVDYGAMGYEDEGEVAFSCVWVARGTIKADGGIQWMPAEQVTSGKRDAIQDFGAVGPGAGFAVVWQEDPEGLRPGSAEGPGEGWSGATVNKKTDVWYSFVKWSDVMKSDVSMSSPVRISNNAACKYDVVHGENGEETGNGESAQPIVTNPYCEDFCVDQDEDGFCVDGEGLAHDGNTGASRPNLFLIPVQADGKTVGAHAIMAYEETKGLGSKDAPTLEEGKYVRYHYFEDFAAPRAIEDGDILNTPNAEGDYENARRIRFVTQPRSAWGDAQVGIVALYKQGIEGQGRPSDIFVRVARGGYDIDSFSEPVNVTGNELYVDPYSGEFTVEWGEENLADESYDNPYDDARAHRAQVRGDFIFLGYSWTKNWAGATLGADHYDFYVRRSFDGGQTYTNAAGEYEPPKNVSRLPNNLYSVVEPRIVATPGTIKGSDGSPTGNAEDVQNKDVVFVAYGTATNSPTFFDNWAVPSDIFFARTTDSGESYDEVSFRDPVTGELKTSFDYLAGTHHEEGECQIRMTPGGNHFFATWNDESAPFDYSDVTLRIVDYSDAQSGM